MQAAGCEQRAPDWPADAPPELAVSALCTCVCNAVCMPLHVHVNACARACLWVYVCLCIQPKSGQLVV